MTADKFVPPVARRGSDATELHGDRRVDEYAWLREKESEEVRAYLEAENAYADAMTARMAPVREKLYEEMLGRIKQTDLTVPARQGNYFYYSRTEEGKQYPIWCRRAGSEDGPEEIVLDGNILALDSAFFALGGYEVSDDGGLLAYMTDFTGFREYTLWVKDLRTGALLADRVENVTGVCWAADGRTLFYGVEDDAKRPYRIFRHRLGETTDTLMALRPVRFRYKVNAPDGPENFGLVAEEVNEVAPELVGHDKDGRIDSVAYDKVYAMMLAELQKQRRLMEAQAATIRRLESRVNELEQMR